MNRFKQIRVLKLATGSLFFSLTMSQSVFAQARDIGGIATDLTSQVSQVGTLIAVISFVLGVALAMAGLMKFRAHSQNPNDPSNKMSTAFVLIFAGAGLVAVPSVLGSGVSTIFGDGAQVTNGNDGFTAIN
ncbi:hypothetical protein KUV57_12935 [Epibacterium sp. DP7N7-1]|nr:hypothetical protein [Epibacterium sp. DP7N7-1]